MNNFNNFDKDTLIKTQAAEIEFLKQRLSKYETLALNQNDEIAETQARLSGTRTRVNYTEI